MYQFAFMEESVLIVQAKNENTMQVETQNAENTIPDPTTEKHRLNSK